MTALLLFALQAAADPLLAPTQAAIQAAVAAGETDATVLALPTDADAPGRHSLCSLDGAATRLVCARYTLTWNDTRTAATAAHTNPASHDGTPLASIIAAERAWVAGGP